MGGGRRSSFFHWPQRNSDKSATPPVRSRLSALSERRSQLCLNDINTFINGLDELDRRETDLVLSILVVANVIDGTVGACSLGRERRLLERSLAACNPPRQGSVSELNQLSGRFIAGHNLPAKDVKAIISDDVEPVVGFWHRIGNCWRNCLECCHCF